jgi:hypothetical protein
MTPERNGYDHIETCRKNLEEPGDPVKIPVVRGDCEEGLFKGKSLKYRYSLSPMRRSWTTSVALANSPSICYRPPANGWMIWISHPLSGGTGT